MTTKKMKRIVTFFVAAAMLVGTMSLFSCGKKGGKYVVLEDNFGAENYAVGFRKGDDALALKVQEILDEMIADGKAGEIAKKWFDSDVMLRNVDFPRELKASEEIHRFSTYWIRANSFSDSTRHSLRWDSAMRRVRL